jgi:hypothetical protein
MVGPLATVKNGRAYRHGKNGRAYRHGKKNGRAYRHGNKIKNKNKNK